mgnify:FL=1
MTGGGVTIVTGPPGSGKTTLCREIAAAARRSGRDVAGVLSPAVFAGAVKTGIEAADLRTGEVRALARLRDLRGGAALERGRWAFDEAALAWGNARLARSTPCDLLVVDELGPLEFEQGRGWTAGLAAVDSGAYGAALVVVRPGLLERARARWPGAEVADAASPHDRRRLAERIGGGGAAGGGPR